MVQPCDTTQVRSNSDFGIKYATIQVYDNNHNSQSNQPLDRAKILRGLSRHVFLPWVTISGQSKFGKAWKYWSTKAVQILLFTSF
jgi:hypothetical protein